MGRASAWPQRPLATAQGDPSGEALQPPPQRATPDRKSARCRAGAGPPMPTPPLPGTHGQRALSARSQRRAAGGGTAPDTRRPPQRRKATRPRGRPPATPSARSPLQGMQAKGTVLDPHARTPAPTARMQGAPTARHDGGRPRERERLTSDAPHNGARHPSGGVLPPPPQHATPARKSAHCGAGAGSPKATPAVTRTHGQRPLDACPKGRAADRGTAPDARCPSQRQPATPNTPDEGTGCPPHKREAGGGGAPDTPTGKRAPSRARRATLGTSPRSQRSSLPYTSHHTHGTCNETGRYRHGTATGGPHPMPCS